MISCSFYCRKQVISAVTNVLFKKWRYLWKFTGHSSTKLYLKVQAVLQRQHFSSIKTVTLTSTPQLHERGSNILGYLKTEVCLFQVCSYKPEVAKCSFNICPVDSSSPHCQMTHGGSPQDEQGCSHQVIWQSVHSYSKHVSVTQGLLQGMCSLESQNH